MVLAAVEPIHALARYGKFMLVGIGLAVNVLSKLAKYIDGLVRGRNGIRRRDRGRK